MTRAPGTGLEAAEQRGEVRLGDRVLNLQRAPEYRLDTAVLAPGNQARPLAADDRVVSEHAVLEIDEHRPRPGGAELATAGGAPARHERGATAG